MEQQTTPILNKYLTKVGKSLGIIKEMLIEVAGLITKTNDEKYWNKIWTC